MGVDMELDLVSIIKRFEMLPEVFHSLVAFIQDVFDKLSPYSQL